MTEFTVLAEGLAFPEGPAVSQDGAIWVSELQGGTIVRIDEQGKRRFFVVGGAPNGLAHAADGTVWFCDQAANMLRRLDPSSGEVTTMADDLDGEPLEAPNDLVFATDGSLLFTCPGESRAQPTGSICRLARGGRVERLATGLMFPNGICLSADGTTLFVAETYGARVSAGSFHPSTPLMVDPLFDTPGPIGADGVAISDDGVIATCVHGAGIVRRFDPRTGSIRDVTVPDARPAGCATDPHGRWSMIVTGAERGIVLGIVW